MLVKAKNFSTIKTSYFSCPRLIIAQNLWRTKSQVYHTYIIIYSYIVHVLFLFEKRVILQFNFNKTNRCSDCSDIWKISNIWQNVKFVTTEREHEKNHSTDPWGNIKSTLVNVTSFLKSCSFFFRNFFEIFRNFVT